MDEKPFRACSGGKVFYVRQYDYNRVGLSLKRNDYAS